MRRFTRRGAVTAFYYLIGADGSISAAELEKLEEIGRELDPENFPVYRELLPSEYEAGIAAAYEPEDAFLVLLEGVDAALSVKPAEGEDYVLPRLLLWDLLVIASCDGEYHADERRLIKHIARISGIEKSVFLEMEQLVQTNAAVVRELAWLSQSERPYAEIRPLITELEHRQTVLLGEAKALIDDEAQQPVEALTYQPDIFETAKERIGEKVAPVASELGEKTSKVLSDTRERLAPVAEGIGRQTGKLWTGIKGFGKKKDAAAAPTEENKHEEGVD